MTWGDRTAFTRRWQARIEAYVHSLGLRIAPMNFSHFKSVLKFLDRRYPPEIAQEICAFDLYRFRTFGHGILLLDGKDQVQGTLFEEGFDTTEKTSFSLRLAVDDSWKGHNLGFHLMIYSALQAMEQGSLVKRGLIRLDNFRSLHINLNKVGWICDHYIPEIPGLGAFFEIVLPLDPMGLTANVVNLEKLRQFIRREKEGLAYRLIPAHDAEAIADLYSHPMWYNWKIASILELSPGSQEYAFVALSPERLQYQV
jgi:GNAT superfamily N-acetyltransferase